MHEPSFRERLLSWLRLSRLVLRLHQHVLGRIVVLLLAVWLLGAAAMHWLEGSENDSFRSFGSSAIAILHYLFSGLESKYPITLAGNVVAIVVLTLGVGVVTLFTASLVGLLVERALEVRKIRPRPWRRLRLRDHVILVGWSERAERVLAQLRSDDLPDPPVVVVVASTEGERCPETREPYRDTWLVEGDVAETDTLARADADRARCALVLSDDRSDVPPDLLAVSRTLALERFAPDVRTVVEVRRTDALEPLGTMGVDEIVECRALGDRMLGQCAIAPGITEVYRELLTFGRGSQEIHRTALPHWLHGLTFGQIRRRLADHPVVPIGYRRSNGSRTVLNPRPGPHDGAGEPLAASDWLVMMADTPRLEPWLPVVGHREARAEAHVGAAARVGGCSRTGPRVRRRPLRVGLCGRPGRWTEVVGQLGGWAEACGHELSIVLFGHRADAAATEVGPLPGAPRAAFATGDPRTRAGLEREIDRLDCLMILGDDRNGRSAEHADHDSLLVALAASALRPDLHLVVEIRRPESRCHFRRLPGAETVSTDELAEKLLAQAAVNPGITDVYADLLSANDSNEIYLPPVPDSWIGHRFREIQRELALFGGPVIALGYRTSAADAARGATVLDPGTRRGDYRLETGDRLVVLAYDEPA